MKSTLLLIATIIVSGCGLDQIRELPASYPAARVRVVEYGDTQDVWVVLADAVRLSSVVDLTVFHPLQPGLTADAASRVMGAATSTRVDEYGNTWSQWQSTRATIETGCVRGSSLIDSLCAWRLKAALRSGEPYSLLSPALRENVEQASNPGLTIRMVYIEEPAAGAKESLWITLNHPSDERGRIEWKRESTDQPSNRPLQPPSGGNF